MFDKVWLLKLFLLYLRLKHGNRRPIADLKANYMDETLLVNDHVIVTEIHEYPDNVIRSVVFTTMTTTEMISPLDESEHTIMHNNVCYYNLDCNVITKHWLKWI